MLAELSEKARAGWPLLERHRRLGKQLRDARRRADLAAAQVRTLTAKRQYLVAAEADNWAQEVAAIDAELLPAAEKESADADRCLALLKPPAAEAEAAFRSEVRAAARRHGPELRSAVEAGRPAGERELVEGLRAPLAKVVSAILTADGVGPDHFERVVMWLTERDLPAPAAPTPAAVGAEAAAGEPAPAVA